MWAGYPKKLWMDRDGSFGGIFAETLEKVSDVDYSAAEAHWQNGEVEAFNRVFRFTAERLIDEKQLVGDHDMKQLGIIVAAAMNDKVRTCGASANMWLFGKSPPMPYDLLDREGQVEALQGRGPDEELRLRQYVGAQADALIAQYKIDEALRTAVSRKGRPSRLTYKPGELVAFWRNIKKKKGKLLRPGWYRGTIIGPHKGTDEGNQNNYWVTSISKLILVSKEQLRPTYGTERWRIDEEELQDFLNVDYDEYDDETGDGPPGDEADSRDLEMVVPPLADEEYSPSLAPDDVEAEAPDPTTRRCPDRGQERFVTITSYE